MSVELREDARTHVNVGNTLAQSFPEGVTLNIEGVILRSIRIIDEVFDILHHLLKPFLVSLAEHRIGTHRLEILRRFLAAQTSEMKLFRVPAKVDPFFEELIEVKVVLDEERHAAGMKHHRLVAHLTLRPNIEAEGTIVILLGLIIPFEGANAYLERNELVDCSPKLLVLLLCGVILTGFLFHAGGAA